MWVIVLLISGLFLLIGLSVTKSNAKNLLSGYNTMTEEQRKHFDIDGYLKIFRKFFLILSISMAVGFVLLQQLISAESAFIYFVILPLVSLPYLVMKSKDFDHASYKSRHSKATYWVMGMLGLVVVGLSILFYLGLTDNEMLMNHEELVIQGMYGQEFSYSEINNIAVTDTLPALGIRTNGFALGSSLKGYFKTETGERVKLLVKRNQPPFLKIITTDGVIYWNSTTSEVSAIHDQIKEKIE